VLVDGWQALTSLPFPSRPLSPSLFPISEAHWMLFIRHRMWRGLVRVQVHFNSPGYLRSRSITLLQGSEEGGSLPFIAGASYLSISRILGKEISHFTHPLYALILAGPLGVLLAVDYFIHSDLVCFLPSN
jgi:hypothetical protein